MHRDCLSRPTHYFCDPRKDSGALPIKSNVLSHLQPGNPWVFLIFLELNLTSLLSSSSGGGGQRAHMDTVGPGMELRSSG